MNENKMNTLYQDIAQYQNDVTRTALYFRKEKINFYDLNKRIDVMAKKLVHIGIKKDMVVTLVSPNIPEAIITFYALNKIGAIVSILHPLIPIKVLTNSIRQTNSEYTILFDLKYDFYKEELKNVIQKVYFISLDPDLTFLEKFFTKKKLNQKRKDIDNNKILSSISPLTQEENDLDFEVNQDANKISVYLRSGGTTGKDKTVILNDKSIRYSGSLANEILGKDIQSMSMIGVLPMFHGFGLAMGIHAPLMNNTSCYLMIKFDTDEIAKAINKNRINILIGVPYMVEKLLENKNFRKAKLENLYMTFIGADKIKEKLLNSFNDLMKERNSDNRIYEGYGLTEVVTVDVVNTIKEHKQGSVGKPIRGVKIKIVNPEDRREELAIGQDGEILLTGPSNCLGYLNCDKKHQPFFTDNKKITYVCTGDIGHLDEDGFLFFKNRHKDLIKIAGYNVFPSDIEEAAMKIEGVVDSAAVYIDGPHPYIHLYLENHSVNDEQLANEVMKYLKENFIKYSLPEKVTCLPHFPRTAIGKIDRKSIVHF